jgi:hypothetical protein
VPSREAAKDLASEKEEEPCTNRFGHGSGRLESPQLAARSSPTHRLPRAGRSRPLSPKPARVMQPPTLRKEGCSVWGRATESLRRQHHNGPAKEPATDFIEISPAIFFTRSSQASFGLAPRHVWREALSARPLPSSPPPAKRLWRAGRHRHRHLSAVRDLSSTWIHLSPIACARRRHADYGDGWPAELTLQMPS